MRRLIVLVLLFIFSGCGTLHQGYVEADRGTYDAFSKRLEGWIDDDLSLDSDKKGDYHGLKDSWEARIVAAEQELAEQDKEDSE